MPDQTIKCPHCNHPIPLTEALTHQLTEHIKADFEKQKLEQEKQLILARKSLDKEKELLVEQQKNQDQHVQTLLETEKKKLWVTAQQKAKETQSKELKDLQEQLQEKEKKVQEAEKLELDLRKKTREIEEKARQQELELARKLDEERASLVSEAKKQEAEEQQRKLSEKDKQIDIMNKTIEDLRRQAQQGSMQIQGDAAEDTLKENLTTSFPLDIISDVPTGITGADLIQKVNGRLGSAAATILWESKNTQAFSEKWLGKLKQDQEAIKAELAILVTRQLPKSITNFGTINGVWVTTAEFAIPLVTTLRLHLTEIEKIKRSIEGRDEKVAVLYNYLTGIEFKNRMENIVLSFVEMQQDLDSERNAFRTRWNKRQKQLERLMISTSGMYGDLQGIIGGALPVISQLELDEPPVEVNISITSSTTASLFDPES